MTDTLAISSSQLTELVLLAIAAAYAALRFLEWLIRDISRRGKVRIITLTEVGTYNEKWVKPKDNVYTTGRGASARPILLDGFARITSTGTKGPLYLVNEEHGWNYVPLNLAETLHKDETLQRLAISNPAMYQNQIATNKAQQSFRANDKDDKASLWTTLAFVGLAAILATLGAVIFLIVKFQNSSAAHAGQTTAQAVMMPLRLHLLGF